MGNALDEARNLYAQFQQGVGNVGNQINNFVQKNPSPVNFVQNQMAPQAPPVQSPPPVPIQQHISALQQLGNFGNNVVNFIQKNPVPLAYMNQQLNNPAQFIQKNPAPSSYVGGLINANPVVQKIQQQAMKTPVLPFQHVPIPGASPQLPTLTPGSMANFKMPGNTNLLPFQAPKLPGSFQMPAPTAQGVVNTNVNFAGRVLGAKPTGGDVVSLIAMGLAPKVIPEVAEAIVNKFGTEGESFLANRNLITKVLNSTENNQLATPEELKQVQLLQETGLTKEALQNPVSVTNQVPKQGGLWDLLRSLYPQSPIFKTGTTEPQTPAQLPEGTVPPQALAKTVQSPQTPLPSPIVAGGVTPKANLTSPMALAPSRGVVTPKPLAPTFNTQGEPLPWENPRAIANQQKMGMTEIPNILKPAVPTRVTANIPIPQNLRVNPANPPVAAPLPPQGGFRQTSIVNAQNNKMPLAPEKPMTGLQALGTSLFKPMRGVLKNSKDIAANTFEQRLTDAENNHQDMAALALTKLENARKQLSPKDWENAIDTVEGKAVAANPKVQNWVDTWKPIAADIAAKTKALDLRVVDSGGSGFLVPWEERTNYFPHYVPKAEIDKAMSDQSLIDKIIKSGKASNEFEAQLYLHQQLEPLRARRFGNLEMHRSELNIPYVKNPKAAEAYVIDAYKRLAYANQFGGYNQEGQNLINNMIGNKHPYEASIAEKLLKETTGYKTQTPEEQGISTISKGIRGLETVLKLPLIAVHHVEQIASISARSGLLSAIRSSPVLIKSLLLDDQSPIAKNAIMEVHDLTQKYDLYGASGRIDQKFLQVMGFNRVIKSLRSFGAVAANTQINAFERKLSSPEAKRYIERAGLNYDDILKRGKLTPDERNAYIRKSLEDTSLLFKPGDLPKLWNTPVGRLMTMFKTFSYNQATKTIPFLFNEAKSGNLRPLLTFLLLGTAIGVGEQTIQDWIQNKPAPSIPKLLLMGLLRGANPGLIGSTVANMAMYPEYWKSNIAGLLGGPIASDIMDIGQTATQLTSPSANDRLTAQRNLVQKVPLVGPGLANTFLPYKSYVGNRPSDILQNGGNPVDLVRQNPDVTVKNQAAQQWSQDMKTATQGLDQNQLDAFNARHPTNANGTIIKGLDTSAEAASFYLNDLTKGGTIINAELKLAQLEQQHGQTVNPIWNLTPAQRSFVWAAENHLPGESNAWSKAIYTQPWYPAYNQAFTAYIKSLPTPTTPDTGLKAPIPTAAVQQAMDNKQWNAPGVQDYLKANTAYNTQRLAAMNLGSVSSVSGTGGLSSSAARSIKTRIKRMTSAKKKFGTMKLGRAKPIKSMKLAQGKMPSLIKVGKMKQVAFKIPKKLTKNKISAIKKLPKFS